jgi:hypothetical protein
VKHDPLTLELTRAEHAAYNTTEADNDERDAIEASGSRSCSARLWNDFATTTQSKDARQP